MAQDIRVTVWNEFRHEKQDEEIGKTYPDGIHGAIAEGLNALDGITARTATLDEPEHGLTEEVLANTDVLTWWGHMAHGEVDDAIVERVQQRVWEGMGLIALHSAHFSKIFKRLMGTSCNLKWREADERERLWVVRPGHPIVEGIGEYIEIDQEEMYGEHFDIPQPDELVFVSWFQGGEVFRSGACWERGAGKVFTSGPARDLPHLLQPDHPVLATPCVGAPVDRPGRTRHSDPIEELSWYDKRHVTQGSVVSWPSALLLHGLPHRVVQMNLTTSRRACQFAGERGVTPFVPSSRLARSVLSTDAIEDAGAENIAAIVFRVLSWITENWHSSVAMRSSHESGSISAMAPAPRAAAACRRSIAARIAQATR